jgi:hypothetical protein
MPGNIFEFFLSRLYIPKDIGMISLWEARRCGKMQANRILACLVVESAKTHINLSPQRGILFREIPKRG